MLLAYRTLGIWVPTWPPASPMPCEGFPPLFLGVLKFLCRLRILLHTRRKDGSVALGRLLWFSLTSVCHAMDFFDFQSYPYRLCAHESFRPFRVSLRLSSWITNHLAFILSQGCHCFCALKSRIGSSGPTAKALACHGHPRRSGSSLVQRSHFSIGTHLPCQHLRLLKQSEARSDCQHNPGVEEVFSASSPGRALNTRIGSSGAGACNPVITARTSAFEGWGRCQLLAVGELCCLSCAVSCSWLHFL